MPELPSQGSPSGPWPPEKPDSNPVLGSIKTLRQRTTETSQQNIEINREIDLLNKEQGTNLNNQIEAAAEVRASSGLANNQSRFATNPVPNVMSIVNFIVAGGALGGVVMSAEEISNLTIIVTSVLPFAILAINYFTGKLVERRTTWLPPQER